MPYDNTADGRFHAGEHRYLTIATPAGGWTAANQARLLTWINGRRVGSPLTWRELGAQPSNNGRETLFSLPMDGPFRVSGGRGSVAGSRLTALRDDLAADTLSPSAVLTAADVETLRQTDANWQPPELTP
jgi:hypothetical protein